MTTRRLTVTADRMIEITPPEDCAVLITAAPVDVDDSVRFAQLKAGKTYRFYTNGETVLNYRGKRGRTITMDTVTHVRERQKPPPDDDLGDRG